MMKVLKLLRLSIEKMYYDRALSDDPLHPDMPEVVVHRQRVRDEMKALLQ